MRPVITPDDLDAVAAELASHGATVGLAGQPDAEAGAGELQQDLAGGLQGGDLRRAQVLELSQGGRVGAIARLRAWLKTTALAHTFSLASRRNRWVASRLSGWRSRSRRVPGPETEASSSSSAATREASTRSIARVVGPPPGQQRRVAELFVGDHRQQRLRQVVIDMGVHAGAGRGGAAAAWRARRTRCPRAESGGCPPAPPGARPGTGRRTRRPTARPIRRQ